MKHLKRVLIILPWLILSALVFGSVAQAASHEGQLAGLRALFEANLDAFLAYLGSL